MEKVNWEEFVPPHTFEVGDKVIYKGSPMTITKMVWEAQTNTVAYKLDDKLYCNVIEELQPYIEQEKETMGETKSKRSNLMFVPFELAKKLKEKGFNCGCIKFYDSNKQLQWSSSPWLEIDYNNSIGNLISAPTISQVLNWLKEEKKLYMCIDVSHNIICGWTYRHYITNLVNHDRHSTLDSYETFEKAAIAGIEYVLNYLI